MGNIPAPPAVPIRVPVKARCSLGLRFAQPAKDTLATAIARLKWRISLSPSRARTLVSEHHRRVDASAVVPQIATHGAWPVLTVVGGVLVAASGALIAWRGHRWRSMSARYEVAPTAAANDARAAATLWTALDRGEDPTDFRR